MFSSVPLLLSLFALLGICTILGRRLAECKRLLGLVEESLCRKNAEAGKIAEDRNFWKKRAKILGPPPLLTKRPSRILTDMESDIVWEGVMEGKALSDEYHDLLDKDLE